MAWVKNLLTGASWEVSQEKADELIRWYPKEYELAPVKTEEAQSQSAEPKSKKAK